MLTAAARVSNGRVIPVYGSVHVAANAVGVAWWATDGELWRGGVLDAKAAGGGEAVLPVAGLLAVVKSCPDGPVMVECSETGGAHVSSGAYKGRLPGFPRHDFPVLPTRASDTIELPKKALLRVLDDVFETINPQASMATHIRGAALRSQDGRLAAFAADGYQLARSVAKADCRELDVLVPARGVTELRALLKVSPHEVVSYGEANYKHVFTLGSDVLISGRLDVPASPNFAKFIPKRFNQRGVCDHDAWLSCASRVALAAKPIYPSAVVTLAPGSLTMRAESQENGAAEESIALDFEGEGCDFRLRVDLLLEFLQTVSTPSVAVEVLDDRHPIVFTSVDDGEADYTQLIQPMVLVDDVAKQSV